MLMFGVAACAKLEAPAGSPIPGGTREAAPTSAANRCLAYEHTLHVETDDDKLVELAESAQAACRAAVEDSCAILEARVSTGDDTGASLRFRATAAGVRKLMALFAAQGRIASRSTSAEDLAGPIADTARQIAMLSDYRTSLEALRRRPANDLDVLMRLTRELAEIQSQIETLAGSQAHLTQRVETELLNVAINSSRRASIWEPVADAGANFGHVLSAGIGGVIMLVAYLLPWSVAAGLLFVAVQGIRRWKRRRDAV